MKKIYILYVLLCCAVFNTQAQDRIQEIESRLKTLSLSIDGLNDTLKSNIGGASLDKFIMGIGRSHNLNIQVDTDIKGSVYHNYSNARVLDVLLLLCDKYDLDIEIFGGIMSFVRFVPETIPVIKQKRTIDMAWDGARDFLSCNLNGDSLGNVANELNNKTNHVVIAKPSVSNTPIILSLKNQGFDKAMNIIASKYDLVLEIDEDSVYTFDAKDLASEKSNSSNRNGGRNRQVNSSSRKNKQQANTGDFGYESSGDLIKFLDARNVPIVELIDYVSKDMHRNFFLYKEPTETVSLLIENATYDDFLNHVLNNSTYSFKKQGPVYLIGEKGMDMLSTTELIQLQNRTVEKITDYIPASLTNDNIELKVFEELNGIIASGSYAKVEQLKTFIREIDKVVPVVTIEVLLVDSKKSNTLKAGVSAGIGEKPGDSYQLLPGATIDFSASSINSLISGLNSFGLVNLGPVTPDFYLSIEALESNNLVKTRSTPKLSTINGHEATMTIGSTEQYAITNTVITGQLTAATQTNVQWKQNNADLSITIKPNVSADEHVTLAIKVSQSDFIGQKAENAPRDQVKREFESMIRVRGGEMIMLGGLEEKSNNNSGSGLPGISRIPILKWFFGRRVKSKEKSKLTIFIKPTIIY